MEDNKKYCCYCGVQLLFASRTTKEHLVPKSWGGNGTALNKKPCCFSCNRDRGNKPLSLWLAELEAAYANPQNSFKKYNLEAKIENVKYWIVYVESAGAKLYYQEHQYEHRKKQYGFII
jgi:hypothetical protein